MVTFVVDDRAYKLICRWYDHFTDYVLRFCDDFIPKFKSAKIILQQSGKKTRDIMYRIDDNKVAYMYIPSTGKEQIRFTVSSNIKSRTHYAICAKFEEIATFYVNISDIFVIINAFLLFGEYSANAKRAMKKKTLLEFKKHTYFTLREIDNKIILDTCKVTPDGENYIIE